MVVTNCTHYWVIEEPSKDYNKGATSFGICKYCSYSKEFSNSYESTEFNKTKRRKPQLVSYQQRMWKIKNHGF